MADLFVRFSEDLQLKGLSHKTIKMYTRAVKQLAHHYQRSPEEITDEELRQYFLYNKNDRIDQWLKKQFKLLLAVPYFMATVTVPEA